MARKTALFTATTGRDARPEHGGPAKRFLLTEMSARRAEDWAIRAFLGLARAGVTVPDDIEAAGFAGIAVLGLRALAGVRYEDAKPLLDEMLLCVQIVEEKATRPLFDDDVEEVQTYAELRREVFKLHVDFSRVASLLKSRREATNPEGGSSDIETSPN